MEVFPNLLLVNWKFAKQEPVHRMVNPTPEEIESLTKYRLVGFNNRKYDNHILWARMIGMSVEQIYALSNRIINEHTGFFGEAYNLSYTDIYDFSSKNRALRSLRSSWASTIRSWDFRGISRCRRACGTRWPSIATTM